MSAVIVVEGSMDARVLKVVLPKNLQRTVTVLIGGERSSLSSVARTMLVQVHRPVAVLIDTDSVEQTIIQERIQTTEELLKLVSGRMPVKVIPFIPTMEIIFFQANGLIRKLYPSTVTDELLLLSQRAPKAALAQLCGQPFELPQLDSLLGQLDEQDIESLRASPPMHELIEFLSNVDSLAAKR
jgi:hypothetical protein